MHNLQLTTHTVMSFNKILISQPRPATERNPYADLESRFGLSVDFRQLIHVEGLDAREFRQQHINPLDYTAVLFNSRLAIDEYFRLCGELRVVVPDSMHYYCISEAVGNYLQKYINYRKRKVFFAEHNKFEELLPAMNRRPQEKYIMVMSDASNDDTIRMFAENGITIKPAIMYRTVATEWPKDEPFDYDIVALFTPSGVASIQKNFPNFEQGDKLFACFGANTIQAAEAAGFRVDIKAPAPGCPSILSAITKYLEENAE